MDDLVYELAEDLKKMGYKNVKSYINLEGDRVATFEEDGNKWLLSIDLLEYKEGE